jgi:hypothetical protein
MAKLRGRDALVRDVQESRLATCAIGLRGSMVIAEKAADPLGAPNPTRLKLTLHTADQLVVGPLMVALAMVVDCDVGERSGSAANPKESFDPCIAP